MIQHLIGARPQQEPLCTVLEYYYCSLIQTQSGCSFALYFNTHQRPQEDIKARQSVLLIQRKHSKGQQKLPRRSRATSSYLSEVPDVEKVEGLKEFTFPHAKDVAARQQERPDVLQAQKLGWEDRKGWL